VTPSVEAMHGNTPTKYQRRSKFFKVIKRYNIITLTNCWLIVRSYSKCSNCCTFTQTQCGDVFTVLWLLHQERSDAVV